MSLEFPSLLVENYMSPKLMFTDWQIYIFVYIWEETDCDNKYLKWLKLSMRHRAGN